jgi:ParB-like chromosome segregation protein Spo0J
MKQGIDKQPVNQVQWIDRNELNANDYNPNYVAPPELELLKTSIKEDGWTQPIVILQDKTIVDGFHRWTVSADPELIDND